MPVPESARAFRWASLILLAACVLRVWHILLLRLDLDRPLVVAAWLALAVVLTLGVRRPTRTTVAFTCVFAALLFLFHWGYDRAASDGREYFVQVRSLVMDRDLDFANEAAVLGTRGMAKMYPFGAAVLWVPFMLLAHAWLHLLNLFGGSYVTDGYRNPYQRAIGLGTLIYGFIGLVLIWRILRDYFDSAVAAIATIAITAGTFLLWYLTVENSMVHAISTFGTMLMLYIWHRGRPGSGERAVAPATKWWVVMGLSAGLMTMIRWQNITFAALAMGLSLWQIRRTPRPAARGILIFSACFFVAFLPQLIFWKIVRGGWFAVPVADHGFDIASLHGLDVLFSPNHGLVSTAPLIYIALLGLPLFIRRDVPMAIVLIAGFVSQIFINGGNDGWWGGAGFGARRFDSCLLTFAVGLGSLLVWFRRRPLVAPSAVIGVLIFVNAVLMLDVRSQTLGSANAITFQDAMNSIYARVGNPFSFPYNAYVAWRYDADWGAYDRLRGRTYNNIEIDIGETGDDMYLGHGWLKQERNEATTYRWTTGEAASIVVPLKAADHYHLEIMCSPYQPAGAPDQTMTVMVNRTAVAKLVLTPGLNHYDVDIPASVLRQNLNSIRFEFAHSLSPRDAGGSTDARSLAVMFDRLKLTRVTGGAP